MAAGRQSLHPARLALRLLSSARRAPDATELWRSVCTGIREADVPIAKATAHLRILHAVYQGLSYSWVEAGNFVTGTVHRYDELPRLDFRGSVVGSMAAAASGADSLRISLEGPERQSALAEFPALAELAEAGLTDHLAMRFAYSTGRLNAIAFSAAKPGFSDRDVELLQALREPLAALLELHAFKGLSRRLLNAYVGPSVTPQIIQGGIRRGQGTIIRAAIWFCDIRDFTRLSNELALESTLSLLDEFFDAMGTAVYSETGEILKFMGDGMLAIFVPGAGASHDHAMARAIRAARTAIGLMTGVNERRIERDLAPIGYGIGLHFGDVMHGNIGTEERLDFTVIGPAVNITSRLCGLCRALDEKVVMSERLRDVEGTPARALGRHDIKGLGSMDVFGLALA